MLMPIANIARVRDSGRVRSARKAVTGPDTAPRPCTTRAATSAAAAARHGAQRGTGDVQEESDDDQRLAADAIGPGAERNLHHRLREPVSAHREAGEERRSARQRARVQREHWQ